MLVSNRHESQSSAERIQKLTTIEQPESDLFRDAYNLTVQKSEEHPYLAAAAAGTAIIGTGLIVHNFGALTRAVGKFTQSAATEARAAFASLSREGAAVERPMLTSTLSGRTNSFALRVDELLSSKPGSVLPELKTLNGAKPNTDISFFPSKDGLRLPGGRTTEFEHDFSRFASTANEDSKFRAGDTPLKEIAEQGFSAPKSMSPKAYKVVRDDGTALYDRATKYPLPRQGADGQFIPSAWVEPGESASIRTIQTGVDGDGAHKGIYITSNPRVWRGGLEGHSVFEVEIGDAASLAKWDQAADPLLRIDTVAQRVRLLRRVPNEEVMAIKGSPRDYLGGGMNNVITKETILSREKRFRELEELVTKSFD